MNCSTDLNKKICLTALNAAVSITIHPKKEKCTCLAKGKHFTRYELVHFAALPAASCP